jgi:hypothetical protein
MTVLFMLVRLFGPYIGFVTTIAGKNELGFMDGVGSTAAFCAPLGLLMTRDGSQILVADSDNHRIRKINVATRSVTTIAGNGSAKDTDGSALTASVDFPYFMAFDEGSAEPESRVYISAAYSVRCLTLAAGLSPVVFSSHLHSEPLL